MFGWSQNETNPKQFPIAHWPCLVFDVKIWDWLSANHVQEGILQALHPVAGWKNQHEYSCSPSVLCRWSRPSQESQFFVSGGNLEATHRQTADWAAVLGRCGCRLPENRGCSSVARFTSVAEAANRAPTHIPTLLGAKRTWTCIASSLSRLKSWARF